MNVSPTFISKHNSSYEKQIILLMIPTGEGWLCLGVKVIFDVIKGNNDKTWFLLPELSSFV